MIAGRLKRAREIAGLSIEQVTAQLGWARGPLLAMENGTAKYPATDESLRALASIYGCSVAWLRGETAELSAENEALLRTCEHTGDRATIREFMQMISTLDPGDPAPPSASERIAKIASQMAKPGLAAKRSHVAREARRAPTREHHCHWTGCTKQVPPAFWGCSKHWFKLPKTLRDRIWAAYKPGQEIDMTPSETYLQVADDVQRWIAEHGGS